MKKIVINLLCILLIGVSGLKAQDFGQILAGSKPDANKYLTSYLEPFGKGEIMNMGRGWFNTARTHKKLGIDITISAQAAIIPDANQFFQFSNSDYSTFKLKSGASSTSLPTFVGDNTSQAITVNTTVNGKAVTYDFNSPTGVGGDLKKNVGFVAVPLPVAQVGIGLFANTDLKVRYFPKTNLGGSTEVGVFGVALQNEIGKMIPFFKRVPLLHLSALVGYNSVNTSYNLPANSSVTGSNQQAVLKINAFTVQGIASIKLALLEIYTSVGYTTGNANANLNGTYVINYKDAATQQTVTATVVDPIALTYKNSGISNTWGARLNFFFLKVFADYTFAPTYNGAGAGVAFSFR